MAGIKRWIPSLIVMIVIFITSSITGPTIEKAGLGNETYHINGHFIMFMILCTTYYKALKNVFNSVVLTSFYGILMNSIRFLPYTGLRVSLISQ